MVQARRRIFLFVAVAAYRLDRVEEISRHGARGLPACEARHSDEVGVMDLLYVSWRPPAGTYSGGGQHRPTFDRHDAIRLFVVAQRQMAGQATGAGGLRGYVFAATA